MKDKYEHNIDKLFHESLDGNRIDPDPVVWRSLSSNIPASKGTNTLSFMAAALVMALLSILLNYQLNNYSDDYDNVAGQAEQSAFETQEQITGQETPPVAVEDQETSLPAMPPSATTVSATEENIEASKGEPSDTREAKAEKVIIPEASAGKSPSSFEKTAYFRMPPYSNQEEIALDDSKGLKGSERIMVNPSPVFNMGLESRYVQNGKLELGATFGPAVSIYPDGQNRNDFTFEILAVYENSRFFAEGGIGANYSTESAKYGITYSTYDSVGYYINVDAFTLDPQNPESIRFQTSTKNIYDSIKQYRIEEKTNKYAYLQLPLRLGYRIIDKGRFSMDIKAGIIFSWQILNDVPEIPYQENDIDQIEVIRNYPDRMKTNWQYTAGLGINYHISNYLRLGIDPFYRQYIKSVYAPDSKYSARSPYAFGVRGGLFIEF